MSRWAAAISSVFEDGHAGQAEFQVGERGPRLGHDAAHRLDALEGGGEGALFLFRPDQQEGEGAAGTAEEILRLGEEIFLTGGPACS